MTNTIDRLPEQLAAIADQLVADPEKSEILCGAINNMAHLVTGCADMDPDLQQDLRDMLRLQLHRNPIEDWPAELLCVTIAAIDLAESRARA